MRCQSDLCRPGAVLGPHALACTQELHRQLKFFRTRVAFRPCRRGMLRLLLHRSALSRSGFRRCRVSAPCKLGGLSEPPIHECGAAFLLDPLAQQAPLASLGFHGQYPTACRDLSIYGRRHKAAIRTARLPPPRDVPPRGNSSTARVAQARRRARVPVYRRRAPVAAKHNLGDLSLRIRQFIQDLVVRQGARHPPAHRNHALLA